MTSYNKGFKKIMLIISLLALNIVEQAASVISSTIPQMSQAFPEQSQVQIELVTTVVSVFVTVFVLISGFITNKIGQKIQLSWALQLPVFLQLCQHFQITFK